MKHQMTVRSFVVGSLLAVFLCAINSYLTLSFGIIEEGPAIAALFFFSFFFLSRKKITTAEMVIVATMGSAGGSLGFISNFFAAKAMTGTPYSLMEMTLFGVVSSIIGLVAVIVLRQILIIQDEQLPQEKRLPWVGAKAVKGVIDALVSKSDPLQPRYLAFFTLGAILYILFNSSGIGWFPEVGMITVLGLSAYGAGLAFSPFVWGGAYLMGFRTCLGFLAGGAALILMAPHLEDPASPHKYVWPGIMFLVTSGLTALAIHWKVIASAIKSLFAFRGRLDDENPIMTRNMTIVFTVAGLVVTVLALYFVFRLTLLIILAMIVIGGLVLNLIATRAAAQTYFNPARVMGILLQGVCTLLGGSSVGTNLTGAGFIAGSGAQGGNLTNDMAYGHWYRIRSSWQFWTQASTVLSCAVVSAVTFSLIQRTTPLHLETGELAAPVAKIWAAIGLLFDPASKKDLPTFAIEAMWLGGLAGILWALLESKKNLRRFIPCSIGFGLGLILPVFYDFGFFAGGLLMWIILPRFLKVQEITLNTIAISCIVGEGIGGILQAILKALGIIAQG